MTRPRIDAATRTKEIRTVLLRVLLLNLAVVAMKLVAFVSANAMSVLAEVVHSSLDASNNVFALWIARVAGRGPDEEHPYGHHKFETLGALVLVGLLSISVFELVQHALLRELAGGPPRVEATPVALALVGASVVVGLLVARYEERRGRALGSDILLADAAHTRSDVYAAVAVLAGLVGVALGYPVLDTIVTLCVAAIIAWTGWRIVKRVVPVLVDERAVEPEWIKGEAEAEAGVEACYGIRSRGRPGAIFAELTISVDPGLDVQRSHEIADAVEARVTGALDARKVVVHVEPAP